MTDRLRIALYAVEDFDAPAIADWRRAHPDVELVTTHLPLSDESLDLAAGAVAVSTQQVLDLHEPAFYARLAAQGVRVIALRTAGTNVIDIPAAARQGIAVTNVPAYSPPAIAELAIFMMLHLLRNVNRYERGQAKGDYTWGQPGRELGAQTVGVVGAGRIGSVVARIAHGFGARVIAFDIAPNHALDAVVTFVDSLDELLRQADVVTVHTPLNPSTTGLIGAREIAMLRPGSLVINTARGPIVDCEAVIAALDAGHLAGAGIDVLAEENDLFGCVVPDGSPVRALADRLSSRDDVVLTPHVAFFTDVAVRNMIIYGLDSALRQASTGDCPDLVAPE